MHAYKLVLVVVVLFLKQLNIMNIGRVENASLWGYPNVGLHWVVYKAHPTVGTNKMWSLYTGGLYMQVL